MNLTCFFLHFLCGSWKFKIHMCDSHDISIQQCCVRQLNKRLQRELKTVVNSRLSYHKRDAACKVLSSR